MKKILGIILFSGLLSCTENKKESMKKNEFEFSTQYNQFYIEDKSSIANTNSSDFWSEEAFKERLAVGNGILGVGTQSYGRIKGQIEILDNANNNIDYKSYDHIVEAGIDIHSGDLQIVDSPNGQVELSLLLKPGKYRVRVYSSNLDSVKETDLENDTDNDYYKIEIWPSDDAERKVLKQFKTLQ